MHFDFLFLPVQSDKIEFNPTKHKVLHNASAEKQTIKSSIFMTRNKIFLQRDFHRTYNSAALGFSNILHSHCLYHFLDSRYGRHN